MNSSHFLVIDDDPFNNTICQIIIKSIFAESEVNTFTVPETALEYVSNYSITKKGITVLLLDINMPTMSGWEFLEHFKKLNPDITKQFKIFILSSSVDQNDIQHAANDSFVVDFISKPLSKSVLQNSVNKVLPSSI